MGKKIIRIEIYWHENSNDIQIFLIIVVLAIHKMLGKITNNQKIIISYGPNKRNQFDLWQILERLKEKLNLNIIQI